MKKIYILFVIFFISCNWVIAQIQFDVNYQKPQVTLPDVASLMKYIDYPTDLHRGLVNIDIPLYTVQEGDLTLPISISYHASGMRVREVNGRIAQGWTLNAEPSISRSINGKPDENGYLRTTLPTNPRPYQVEEYILNGAYEMTPDKFYYKLLDKSGKFYYKKDVYSNSSSYEIVVQPYEPIKITNNFEITDDKGVNYKFTGGFGSVDGVTTQWLGSSVTSASGRYYINFGYTKRKDKFRASLNCNPYYIAIEEETSYDPYYRDKSMFQCGRIDFPILTSYGSENYGRDPYTYNVIPDPYYEECCVEDRDGYLYYYGALSDNVRYGNYNCVLNYPTASSPKISYQHLETIITTAVEVKFYYGTSNDDDEEPLQKIEVRDKLKNEIIRTIHFTQSRFNSSTTLRKLDEIRIVGKNGEVEKYTFEYDRNNDVPRRNIILSDHWGFIGGRYDAYGTGVPIQEVEVTAYTGYFLTHKYVMNIGDVYKEGAIPSPGMLKSITYPTGRKSTFYFEPHQYLHNEYVLEPEIRKAGGMRIAKIEEYDPVSGKKLIKQYKYGESENGIGYARRQPHLSDYTYEYDILNFPSDWYMVKVRMFFPEPLAPMTYDGGCSTKYDYVSEFTMGQNDDGSLVSNGKTVYKFRFDHPGPGYIQGTTINYDYDAEWATGELLQKTDYKYDNRTGYVIPVLRNTYRYGIINPGQIPAKKYFKRCQIRFNDSSRPENEVLDNYYQFSGRYPYDFMSYYISCGGKRIVSETTESFDEYGNQSVKETKTYSYDNTLRHPYPAKIEYKSGSSLVKTEEFTYPQEITYPSSAESALIRNNQINTLLKKKTSFGGRKWVNKSTYGLKGSIPVPVSIWAGEENKEEERVKILLHDSYGNPVQVQMDGISTIFLWGYNGTRMIAEIRNATYDQIKGLISESTLNAISARSVPLNSDWTLINTLRATALLRNSHINTYKHNLFDGVTEMTDPSGKTTYYEYGSFSRLKEIQIDKFDSAGQKSKKKAQYYEYNYRNQ